MTKYIDITRRLEIGTAVWPGDTDMGVSTTMSISRGDTVNLSTLNLSAHTGSHIDAPYHYLETGETVEKLPIEPYWGPAQVVTVSKKFGPLHPEDFSELTLGQAPRLLVRSAASLEDQSTFPSEYPYPSPQLADYLGEQGVVLYGSDGPSMDHQHSKSLEGHLALHRNRIAILEWLDLSKAADGLYELVALPLRIGGGDGSPVRAVLRQGD